MRPPIRVLHLIEDLGAGGAERLLYVNLARLDRSRFSGIVCHLYDRALHWKQPILELASCRLSRPQFVAVSQYVKQSAVQYLHVSDALTTVIYNPIDLELFVRNRETTARAAELRAGLKIAEGDPVVLCVARLDPQK